uniref:Uncharacterized protein n=1 Tax=Arundo donax TaxID=35708 RepID=A0A0A9APU8_ARUDO
MRDPIDGFKEYMRFHDVHILPKCQERLVTTITSSAGITPGERTYRDSQERC